MLALEAKAKKAINISTYTLLKKTLFLFIDSMKLRSKYRYNNTLIKIDIINAQPFLTLLYVRNHDIISNSTTKPYMYIPLFNLFIIHKIISTTIIKSENGIKYVNLVNATNDIRPKVVK